MTDQPYTFDPHPEALEEVLWEINKGVLPTLALARHLSPEALQELGGYAYQQGAIMDAMSMGH